LLVAAEKVTVALATGVPFEKTVAESIDAKAVLMTAFCWTGPVHVFTAVHVPAATVMVWGGGAVATFVLQPVTTANARMIDARPLQ
jgi:hypothetical protein